MSTLPAVINQVGLDPQLESALHVDLDWLPYRGSFRDPVVVRRAVDAQGGPLEHGEIAIDLSQVEPSRFAADVTEALRSLRGSAPSPQAARAYLDDFGPLRTSVIWQF